MKMSVVDGNEFRAVTDELGSWIDLRVLADALDVSEADLRRARLDRRNEFYLPPPQDWRRVLARMLRLQAADLARRANDIYGESVRAILV
ncbi:MAG: hypothetical protein RRA92_08360 [Gemmatimonadota bacterium]|nr:hypothetical protein [Gemmatimonadota bacterium]